MAALATLAPTVDKATSSLLKWNDAKSSTAKPQLLSQDEFVYLILTLKKIPPQGRSNPYKIPLPTPLRTPADTEICLIIDDRSNTKKPILKSEAKDKIEAEQIGVAKILKLSKLRNNYRPFEAKRKLCDSFDFFLADKRVVPLLPKLLGKEFFKKKKLPVPIDLEHKNWKEQIERVCGSALFYLKTGTCCVIKVAKLTMKKDEIVENVVKAIDGIVEVVPKGWSGVRSLHLKLNESLALPIYQAMPDMKLKIAGANEEEEKKGQEVTVSEVRKGEKTKKKTLQKGRIHEVKYMDTSVDEVLVNNELGKIDDSDDDEMLREDAVLEGKKRKKMDSDKVSNKKEKEEKVNMVEDAGTVEEKKKKKSGSGKLKTGEMNSKKLKTGEMNSKKLKTGEMNSKKLKTGEMKSKKLKKSQGA